MVRGIIFAVALLTFTISFDEFVVALFLSGAAPTLPVNIWTWLRFPREVPSVLALSTLILLFSIVLAFAALMIARIGAPDTPVWGGRHERCRGSGLDPECPEVL